MATRTLDDAIALAVQAHAGQYDKAGEPYILHPLRVMLNVPSSCRMVAVLHDVVEDSPRFWHEVAATLTPDDLRAVTLLTRMTDDTYGEYIERIATACHKRTPGAETARLVKLADLKDNMNRARGPLSDRLRARYIKAHDRLTKGA